MSSATLTRRQTERHARTLQDLIRSVPGNNVCADCAAKNPGWASWNLGIFLCMQCATVHRKLGTHISRVKSLTMDTWTAEQVDSIKRQGNSLSNRQFNISNTSPDWNKGDAGSAMERFIFKKYNEREFMDPSVRNSNPRSSSGNSEEIPPPLPPKPESMTLVNASTFPSYGSGSNQSNTGKRQPFQTPDEPLKTRIGISLNKVLPGRTKVSRILGGTVNPLEDRMDPKLNALKQLGYLDEQKNLNLLRLHNGNLQRVLDALGSQSEGPEPPLKESHTWPIQAREITSAGSGSSRSANPFQTGAAVSTTPSQSSATPSFNPFLNASNSGGIQQQLLQNQFLLAQQQNAVPDNIWGQGNVHSNQANPLLFPHRTGGGFPNPHIAQGSPYLQTYTPPPMPTSGGFVGGFSPSFSPILQSQPGLSSSSSNSVNNPFFTSFPSQTSSTVSIPTSPICAPSPFPNIAAPQPSQPFAPQFPNQSMFPLFSGQEQQTMGPGVGVSPSGYQFASQQQNRQPLGTIDDHNKNLKASIMALYNAHPPITAQTQTTNIPSAAQVQGVSVLPSHSTSVSTQTGSHNPFAALMTGGGRAGLAAGPKHKGTESIDFSAHWNEGRHSPDAFSSLSFRYGA